MGTSDPFPTLPEDTTEALTTLRLWEPLHHSHLSGRGIDAIARVTCERLGALRAVRDATCDARPELYSAAVRAGLACACSPGHHGELVLCTHCRHTSSAHSTALRTLTMVAARDVHTSVIASAFTARPMFEPMVELTGPRPGPRPGPGPMSTDMCDDSIVSMVCDQCNDSTGPGPGPGPGPEFGVLLSRARLPGVLPLTHRVLQRLFTHVGRLVTVDEAWNLLVTALAIALALTHSGERELLVTLISEFKERIWPLDLTCGLVQFVDCPTTAARSRSRVEVGADTIARVMPFMIHAAGIAGPALVSLCTGTM